MKALLYKELKLAMHPMCYVFMFVFPVMMLIPSFPLGVGFIYLLTAYPVLFLGANKGQQSNDLLFSTLLPVRKKDIVLARITTVGLMHFVYIGMMSIIYPLAFLIENSINLTSEKPVVHAGIGLNGFVSLLAIALIGFALADLIFFPIYYKKGRSIAMSTLLTILGFVIYIGIFTIGLPYAFEPYKNFCESTGDMFWIQIVFFAGGLLFYFLIHLLVYKLSSKELERVDF